MASPSRSPASRSSPSSPSSRLRVSSKPTFVLADPGLGLAEQLWIKSRRESFFAMFSPFMVSLASGNLSRDAFRRFVAQDASFLKAFAEAFELAGECADDDDAKQALSRLRKGVLEELKAHHSLMQEWGLEVGKDCNLNPATVKYTEFLLATASGKADGEKTPDKLTTPFEKTKIPAYTLSAITPCIRIHAFLAMELRKLLGPGEDSHPYEKWIEKYSSKIYQASARQTEDLLEQLSVSLTGEELDIIGNLYQQAMKHEVEFFNSQSPNLPTIVPIMKKPNFAKDCLLFLSDFDLSCSVLDSAATLAEMTLVTAPKSDLSQSESKLVRMSLHTLRSMWDKLSKQYTEEYNECIEMITPADEVEYNHDLLVNALEKVSDIEKRANCRVIESEVLKGLKIEDIIRTGELLMMQEGRTGFFQNLVKIENVDVSIHILSHCWCGDLIRSWLVSGHLDDVDVHANELAFSESITTGEMKRKVETPIDKLQVYKNILKNNEKNKLTVYVGDCVGDLLCLLEADIGIVIGSSSSLRRLGTQFGVTFIPLFAGVVRKQKEISCVSAVSWKGGSGILYTVSGWAEIHALFLGC